MGLQGQIGAGSCTGRATGKQQFHSSADGQENCCAHVESVRQTRVGHRPGHWPSTGRIPGRQLQTNPADSRTDESSLRCPATAQETRAASATQHGSPHCRPGPAPNSLRPEGRRPDERIDAIGPRIPPKLLQRKPTEPVAAPQTPGTLPHSGSFRSADRVRHLPGQCATVRRTRR